MTTSNRFSKLAGLLTEADDRGVDEVEDDSSSEALHTMDPADDQEATLGSGGGLSADLTAGYSLGAYGIASMSELRALQRAVLQEMKTIEEGMFDFFTKRTSARDPYTDASGMLQPSLATPAVTSLEHASHIFAKMLVEHINQMQGGWHNVPTSRGIMQDFEAAGWMDIGREFWPQVVQKVRDTPVEGGVPYGTADLADQVLSSWEREGYVASRKPDSAIGNVGPWLAYRGWVTLEELARRSKEAGV
jgi:hypothetical protein